MTIGVLLKIYPKISETFILGELLGLERLGLSLHIFSLRRPTDALCHSASADVQAPLSYLPTTFAPVFMAHLALALARPWRYLRTAMFVLRRDERNRFGEFVQAGSLAGMLRKAGITHLHAHFASEPAGVAELAARLGGISYSISAHAKDIYLSSPASLSRKLDGARFTVTCTEYNRRHLAALGGPRTRILTMYHGIDLDRFTRGAAAVPQQPPLVLSVGRLRPKKGYPVLIEACRVLHDAGVSLRLRIIGYGDEHARLKNLIGKYGLDAMIELPGKMPQDQVIESYRAASVFALPCQIGDDGDRDGIPNVLLEAMAMQVPVVSTPISGIPEVIRHGVNGLLVEPEDPIALAAAIRYLLDQAASRERVGAAGREIVARMFCNETNLKLVRDLLVDAARTTPASPLPMAQSYKSYAR